MGDFSTRPSASLEMTIVSLEVTRSTLEMTIVSLEVTRSTLEMKTHDFEVSLSDLMEIIPVRRIP